MPKTAKKRISKLVVDGLKEDTIIWHTAVKGFGVRRQKGTAKTYFVKKRRQPLAVSRC